jgi:cell division protein FtsI (penicillin-binding protein 3)
MSNRIPLRPLASIIAARRTGDDPDQIERENTALRNAELRDKLRQRAEGRLVVLAVGFALAFGAVALQMGKLAATDAEEPRAVASYAQIHTQRADIVDAKGRILATNLLTQSLYAQPRDMVDPLVAAQALARIFPDLNAKNLEKTFTSGRSFVWVKRRISPEQRQAVHDIGEPGLLFGPREMRLYPNGRLAAHVLGGTRFGQEDVKAAELVGVAGVERQFDDVLRDPSQGGGPLRLSIDITVQQAMREILANGQKLMQAKGIAAVLMKADTGQIVAMASLPDFDPNERPAIDPELDAGESPLFNRAAQGTYELGSTYKIFTAAQMIELGLANPGTMIDTRGPLKWGKYKIKDFHDYGAKLSVSDVIVKSSNIGTARMAQQIGVERQQDFLRQLGLLEATPLELPEARGAVPQRPENWSELSAMTISYGHGITASLVHLAAAYASILNGGLQVTPSLQATPPPAPGPRVVSEATSAQMRQMLRKVVTQGTASMGEVPGYGVAGKTGSADKPKKDGGYYDDKVIATFASVFPAANPQYVLVVTLDEPQIEALGETRRTAGWTAVPVAAELIRRTAPLLGVRPAIAAAPGFGVVPARAE